MFTKFYSAFIVRMWLCVMYLSVLAATHGRNYGSPDSTMRERGEGSREPFAFGEIFFLAPGPKTSPGGAGAYGVFAGAGGRI